MINVSPGNTRDLPKVTQKICEKAQSKCTEDPVRCVVGSSAAQTSEKKELCGQ